MKIRYKIESVVKVYFKKLLTKVVNLIFKYILSSYFIECGWRCSNTCSWFPFFTFYMFHITPKHQNSILSS